MSADRGAPTAVQFGAGNIGRGFLAQLFAESGLRVQFVDVSPAILAALNEHGSYDIHIVGPSPESVVVSGVSGIDGRDLPAVTQAVAACRTAACAVGAAALPAIAPNLAAGLTARYDGRGGPLNILVCENLHNAADVLRTLVADNLPAANRDAILNVTGFAQAVVSRMVPLQTSPPDDPLAIRVEAYKRLPVDASAIIGELPEVAGIEPVSNFAAHVERKLYTHNAAHAALGYLGWECGLEFAWEALERPDIRDLLTAALEETGRALMRKHGFPPLEHAAHVEDLLARFANRALGDTCFRLARDPLRKLAPDDRLVGSARLCELQGVEPRAVSEVIGSALRFADSRDPSAVSLQTMLRERGLEGVLRDTCGIGPGEPLASAIREAYARPFAEGVSR